MLRLKEEGELYGNLLKSVSFGEIQKLKEIAIRNKIMGMRSPLDDYYAEIGSSTTKLKESVYNRLVKFYENAKIDRDFIRYHLTETVDANYISDKFIIPELKTELKYTGMLPNVDTLIKPVENVLSSYASGEFLIDGGVKARNGEIFADAVIEDIEPYVQKSRAKDKAKEYFTHTVADKVANAVNASMKTSKDVNSIAGKTSRVSDIYKSNLIRK